MTEVSKRNKAQRKARKFMSRYGIVEKDCQICGKNREEASNISPRPLVPEKWQEVVFLCQECRTKIDNPKKDKLPFGDKGFEEISERTEPYDLRDLPRDEDEAFNYDAARTARRRIRKRYPEHFKEIECQRCRKIQRNASEPFRYLTHYTDTKFSVNAYCKSCFYKEQNRPLEDRPEPINLREYVGEEVSSKKGDQSQSLQSQANIVVHKYLEAFDFSLSRKCCYCEGVLCGKGEKNRVPPGDLKLLHPEPENVLTLYQISKDCYEDIEADLEHQPSVSSVSEFLREQNYPTTYLPDELYGNVGREVREGGN